MCADEVLVRREGGELVATVAACASAHVTCSSMSIEVDGEEPTCVEGGPLVRVELDAPRCPSGEPVTCVEIACDP